MSDVSVTFSGKYGDILWSMATVEAIASVVGSSVDFACMPLYRNLLPLLQEQSYIRTVSVIEGWRLLHSNYGDQPWNPPNHMECIQKSNTGTGPLKCYAGYDQCWHLGYRSHPGRSFGKSEDSQLIDYIAEQQGLRFNSNPLPFLSANLPGWSPGDKQAIAIAFNDQYDAPKKEFARGLLERLGNEFDILDVGKSIWPVAAKMIESSVCFVGCRSANFVMAHGLNKKCFIYEPHPARNFQGHLGKVFGCSYGQEVDVPLNMPIDVASEYAASTIRSWAAAAQVVTQ